jgi:hypothetical protein
MSFKLGGPKKVLNTPVSSSQLMVTGRANPGWRGLALPQSNFKGKEVMKSEKQKYL